MSSWIIKQKIIAPKKVRSMIRKIAFILEPINKLRYYIWLKSRKITPVLKEPIFIIGCPRSGTSLFVKLYSLHPMVANWSEAGQVWDPINYYNQESEHCWDASLVTKESVIRLHSTFEWYRHIRKKKRFVNKHPRNSVRIKYLRKIFPDAYFIHLIRDGRAVVNSIANKIEKEPLRQKIPFGNFCKPPNWRKYLRDDIIEQTAIQWREIVYYILNNKQELGDRYFEIKYEDMCLNPRGTLASTFHFAGLSISDSILAHIPEKLENMNHKYKEKLSLEQINSINTIQKDLLKITGYEL